MTRVVSKIYISSNLKWKKGRYRSIVEFYSHSQIILIYYVPSRLILYLLKLVFVCVHFGYDCVVFWKIHNFDSRYVCIFQMEYNIIECLTMRSAEMQNNTPDNNIRNGSNIRQASETHLLESCDRLKCGLGKH